MMHGNLHVADSLSKKSWGSPFYLEQCLISVSLRSIWFPRSPEAVQTESSLVPPGWLPRPSSGQFLHSQPPYTCGIGSEPFHTVTKGNPVCRTFRSPGDQGRPTPLSRRFPLARPSAKLGRRPAWLKTVFSDSGYSRVATTARQSPTAMRPGK